MAGRAASASTTRSPPIARGRRAALAIACIALRGTDASPITRVAAPAGARAPSRARRRSPTTIDPVRGQLLRRGRKNVANPRDFVVKRVERRECPDVDGRARQTTNQLHPRLGREAAAEGCSWSDGGDLLKTGGHAELDRTREVPPAEPVVDDQQLLAAGESASRLQRSPPKPSRARRPRQLPAGPRRFRWQAQPPRSRSRSAAPTRRPRRNSTSSAGSSCAR